MKRLIWACGLPVLVISGCLTMTRSARQAPAGRPEMDVSVRPAIAAEGTIVTVPGAAVEVASEVSGRIETMLANEGDWVAKGQTIAVLDRSELRGALTEARAEQAIAEARLAEIAAGSRPEEIREAEAALASASAERTLAARDLERYQALYRTDAVSLTSLEQREKAFEVALNGFKAAVERHHLLQAGPRGETLRLHERLVERSKAGIASLERLIDKSVIRAPISGRIIRKNVEAGEVLYAERPVTIATIADVHRIEVNAEVDETDIGRLAVGAAVEITADAYRGQRFSGAVREIADYVGRRVATPTDLARNVDMRIVQVKITVPAGAPFRLGMTVNVRIGSVQK